MSCSFLGQSLFDLLCQFVVVQSPLLGKLLGFFLGQVNHGSMLRLGEVGGEHHAALVETSQLLEVLEVRGLLETEIVYLSAIVVVHQNPLIFADSLPYGRSFAGCRFFVYPGRVVLPASVNLVRGCLLDAWSSVVGYVEEMVFALRITDVAVNGCLVFDRIFE